jgi:hypothetical protein
MERSKRLYLFEQQDLFDTPTKAIRPRKVGALPDTSHEAYAKSGPVTAHQQNVILGILRRENYLTCYEIAERSNGELDHVQVARQHAPLIRSGKIENSDQRRPGPTGRKCIVWKFIF